MLLLLSSDLSEDGDSDNTGNVADGGAGGGVSELFVLLLDLDGSFLELLFPPDVVLVAGVSSSDGDNEFAATADDDG